MTATSAAQDLDYVRADTREASRQATLARYMPAMQWTDWHLIGPFDNTDLLMHDVVYPPELAIDLTGVYQGKDGRDVRWQSFAHSRWSPISLKRFGDEADNTNGIAYLYREVVADRAADVTFEVGSDDGVKLWLNGRLLLDADVYRGLNVQDHRIDLPLVKGRNTLLVKVTQGVGGWDFQMRPKVDGRLIAQLDYRLDQDFPGSPEARHYRLLSILEPPGVFLEVGGLDVLPDSRPIVATRRGEVWIIDGAYDDPPFDATFTLFASGLHEPLGARWIDDEDGGSLYVAQRGELTRLLDIDGDDRADLYETVSDGWGISGNYHEYAFGPKLDGEGRMWVTLCVGFCGQLGKSIVPWRGWAVIINPDGTVDPVCGGLRAPNGLGRNAAGDMFYTDNQGDWVATCKLSHLERGDWHGHPSSDRWYEQAGLDQPDREKDFKPPAVWFPYGRMGQSSSDILLDDTGGAFGPFEGQLFVGDQTNASIMRVDLERIDGVYQGACFPFRSGLACGVNRMQFGPDGSMLAGLTNRGWGSLGGRSWGLQRVVYTGVLPFEVLHMRVTPDGFDLEFTMPVDPETAGQPSSYELGSFTYNRFANYGSPEIDHERHVITRATVSADGRSVRLTVDGLRTGYVHELIMAGVRSETGDALLHDEAYYTVNRKPVGSSQ
jgi:hypothetical protein